MLIRKWGRRRVRAVGLLLCGPQLLGLGVAIGTNAALPAEVALAAEPPRPSRASVARAGARPSSARSSSSRSSETMPGLFESFFSSDDSSSATRVPFLGRRRDRAAARRLVELARDPETRASGRSAYALVVALAAHARGPERDAVVRTLLGLYRVDAGPVRDERGPLHARVRGAAALALARSDHPVALRALWSDAQLAQETDPLALPLAREALRAHPISSERARALALPALRAPTKTEKEPCSPERLARSESDDARAECQADLLTRGAAPPEWLDEASWAQALGGPSRLHALRTLTLLAREHEELRSVTLRAAERDVHSDAPRLRASARFALAVLSPEQAVADWARLDAVERAALLRAAHLPAIRDFLRDELRVRPLPPGPLALVAERVVFGFPIEFERPARLRRVEERGPRLLALSGLAHWLRPDDDSTTGPSVLEVRGWLGSSLPLERAATAFGLGSAPASRASGLLVRAYENEADPAVRRALVHALARRGSPELDRVLSIVASLEPDRAAREVARRALRREQTRTEVRRKDDVDAPSASRSFTFVYLPDGALAAREIVYIATEEGRVIPILPEPDGYYALEGLTFTTPAR